MIVMIMITMMVMRSIIMMMRKMRMIEMTVTIMIIMAGCLIKKTAYNKINGYMLKIMMRFNTIRP
jgi:hypothetical protein